MPVHDWTKVDAGTFHAFHFYWISKLSFAIQQQLPADYYAMPEQVSGLGTPDILTLQFSQFANLGSKATRTGNGSTQPENSGGVATTMAPPKAAFHEVIELDEYSGLSRSVVVRHVSGDRVVAVLEVVSPGNKWSEDSFESFRDKIRGLIRANIHVLILDLFPPTNRDPNGIHAAVWSYFKETEFQMPAEKPLTLVSYLAGSHKHAYIEPLPLGIRFRTCRFS